MEYSFIPRNSSWEYDTSYSQKSKFVTGMANMFYLASPRETVYYSLNEVPHFYRQAWPYFLVFILIENVVLWMEKKPLMRVNDGITSISHGLIQQIGRMIFRGSESAVYVWIYENYRIVDLPWDSVATWYLAAIGVDFCYYWVHRASHEIHILWAQHQVHHSSEDFNLGVGLRQSVLQGWCGVVFYWPLAVIVPPAQFLTHQQFNLLYQFWIHTETIKSLGPLEWVLNTPKHHRVHHGSVLYCLDKNYGGTLIIWDRLFGTFAEEREKEEIIYGLVYNQPSFNPLFLQTFYNVNVYSKFKLMRGWQNKASAIFKGPSWLPGKPWTGAIEDKPDIRHRVKYDVQLPIWCNIYIVLHFAVVIVTFGDLIENYMSMSPVSVLVFVSHLLVSLTVFGFMLEDRPNACLVELLRCLALATLIQRNALTVSFPATEWFFLLSAIFWTLYCLHVFQIKVKN